MKKWIAPLLPFFVYGSVLAIEAVTVNQFGGLNTSDSTLTLQEGQTPDSQNVVTDLNGLQGRKGFTQFSTQTASDIYQFALSNGTRYIVKRASNTLTADTGAGTFNITVSTIPSDRRTVVSQLGDRLYFMNTLDGLKYWNGTSVTVASTPIAGTMLVTSKGRLWVGGIGGQERVIRISKYLDGTSWTAPTSPTVDDAAIITVAGAFDENLQALYATFQDKVIWFKKNSFGGIFGSNRSNFIQRTFSDFIGVASPETIQDCDGKLRWLGNNRKVWEFDGAQYYKISDQVDALFSAFLQGDSASRTSVLTTQGDWELGTSVPTGNLSTTISPGSVVLSTMAVVISSDDTQSNFGAGTLVGVDSVTSSGDLYLATSSSQPVKFSYYVPSDPTDVDNCVGAFNQSFTNPSSYLLGTIVLRIKKTGSIPNVIVSLLSNVGSSPGSILTSTTIAAASISTSFSDISCPVPPITLASNTTYWVNMTPESGCSGGTSIITSYGLGTPRPGLFLIGGALNNPLNLEFKVLGKLFQSTGSITSRTFDMGFSTDTWLFNLSTLTATVNIPTNSTITFQTQTSADGSNFDALVPVANNSVSTSTTRRYIRYRANFSTTNTSTSPYMSDISIANGPFLKSSGTYTSKLVSVGNSISAWGPITIGNSVSSGGTETFQVGSTNTASISAITNWTTITNNTIPTISTNPYVAFRSTFTATRGTDTVSLNDFTFSWTDGSTIRAASGYIDQRYWLAVTTQSATNNIVYVYDRKKQWQRYIGINADCMGIYNSNLYFGSTSGIFQTEQGYSDAGSNIVSYYTTKDLYPSGTDIPTNYFYTYLTTDYSDSILGSSFSMDGSTFTMSLGNYQMNTYPGNIQNFKVPFYANDVTSGKYLNMKWTVIGTSRWRLINSSFYHEKGSVPQ